MMMDDPIKRRDDEQAVMAKVAAYEALIDATVRKFRSQITFELADEDIAQELRMKVLYALRRHDPARLEESRHVFGAILNRVKDLISKRVRSEELLIDHWPGDDGDGKAAYDHSSVVSEWGCLQRTAVTELGDGFGVRMSDAGILAGLTDLQATVALGLAAGFTMMQIVGAAGITQTQYRRDLEVVKERLAPLRNTIEMRNGRHLD